MSERFLGDEQKCFICPEFRVLTPPNYLTRDHVFPLKAWKDHPLVFSLLVRQRANLVTVCREDHDTIDQRKMSAYREHGLEGLVDHIAAYPRATDTELYEMQLNQWFQLFTTLRDHLYSLNGQTPIRLRSEYRRISDLASYYIQEWQSGKF